MPEAEAGVPVWLELMVSVREEMGAMEGLEVEAAEVDPLGVVRSLLVMEEMGILEEEEEPQGRL